MKKKNGGIAKRYGFERRTIFSTEGSLGWGWETDFLPLLLLVRQGAVPA